MKKAFIILAHQMPEQLNLFLEQLLQDKDTDIFIHVNALCKDIISSIMVSDRIFISEKNIPIHWGSDEILKAVLIMYQEVIDRNEPYGYVIVCTGQDLLIREDLDSYLTQYDGRIFIESKRADQGFARAKLFHKWPDIYRRKYDFKLHPIRIARSLRFRALMRFPYFYKKPVFSNGTNIIFYYDMFWHVFPFKVVQYINEYLYSHNEFMEIYTNAIIPEENFFTTLLMNSPYSSQISFVDGKSDSLTYIKGCKNNHPPILTKQDIPLIENSGYFFARKFDMRVDKEVIDYFHNKIVKGKNK